MKHAKSHIHTNNKNPQPYVRNHIYIQLNKINKIAKNRNRKNMDTLWLIKYKHTTTLIGL